MKTRNCTATARRTQDPGQLLPPVAWSFVSSVFGAWWPSRCSFWTTASTSRRCGKPLTVGLSRGIAGDRRSLMMTKTVKVTKNLDFKHQNRRNSRLHHPDQTCRRHQCSLLACREVAHQDDGRIEADDEGWSDADEEPQRKILRGTTSGRSLGHSISGNAYRGRAQIVTKASAVARNAQGPEGNCAAASQANQCTSANQRGHQF